MSLYAVLVEVIIIGSQIYKDISDVLNFCLFIAKHYNHRLFERNKI